MSDIAARTPPEATLRRLTTVTAIDICGYAQRAEADDADAVRTVQLVAQAFGEIAARRRGRIFHRAGDGFLAEFPSASDGVLAAVEVIEEMRKRDTLSPNGVAVKLRAGVHVGDVVDQPDGDLLGHGVNVAARLQAEAGPGRVLVSLHAVNLVREKIDVAFHRRGPLLLKNIDEPVTAFEALRTGKRPRLLQALRRRLASARPAAIPLALTGALVAGVFLASQLGPVRQQVDPSQSAGERLTHGIIASGRRYDSRSALDTRYLTRVFTDLARSRDSGDAVVAGLVADGDVEGAMHAIDEALDQSTLAPDRRRRLLHQLGALAYEREPLRAIAAYRDILNAHPGDFDASFRLALSLAIVDRNEEALEAFDHALKVHDPSDEHGMIELLTRRASSLMHLGDRRAAIQSLETAEKRAQMLGAVELDAAAKTSLAQAYLGLNEIPRAKSYAVAAHALQSRYGLDRDRGRALNILGQIAEKEGDLQTAAAFYEQQEEITKAVGYAASRSEALWFLANLKLAEGDLEAAERSFSTGLRVARAAASADNEFMHLVGLAEVATRRSQRGKACSHISEAEKVFSGSVIGPRTQEKLSAIGCPFAPANRSSLQGG
jgi:class 3 adenylate cyclase/tetratricopeptide (TPR) repeat protein